MTTRRPGFTLLEVTIALVVSGIVVLLGQAALGAGLDVQQRVRDAQEVAMVRDVGRAVLRDAIRHAVDGGAPDAEGWRAALDASGRLTRLALVTRGVTPPFGAGPRWQVVLHADSGRVVIEAAPLDAPAAPLRLEVPGAASVSARFRSRTDERWGTRWDDPTRLPSAIELQFADAAGAPLDAPVLARTHAVGAP